MLQNFQVMEIQEIKQRLTLSMLLQHYGLKADKQNRLKCPFHNDKTPSLQLYYKTQTAYCFSTNCNTHGKAIDVIDIFLYKENCTKHEAIKKAIQIIGGEKTRIVHIIKSGFYSKTYSEKMRAMYFGL